MASQPNQAKSLEGRINNSSVRRVVRKLEETFTALELLPFLKAADKQEFHYFKRLFRRACLKLDSRVDNGLIKPWSKRAVEQLRLAAAEAFPRGAGLSETAITPRCLALPPGPLRLGLLIGSFDPFQMTHLETALRFLCRGKRPADLVLVVPEGSYSALKPDRSDYDYRYDILWRQAAEVFRPFIIPLDIGESQDTIGIVKRLLSLFYGRELILTHVLGSDMFPLAVHWYPEDLAVWQPLANNCDVVFNFGTFVVKRSPFDQVVEAANRARKLGLPVQVDPKPIGTPSSTALRQHGIFTILFPTAAILEKLEVVFRYGMHRPWLTNDRHRDYEI